MIQEGWLWFDDTAGRSTGDKVARGANRYQQKYGHRPDVCYVNPAHLKKEDELSKTEVKVMSSTIILPYHFWFGVFEKRGR